MEGWALYAERLADEMKLFSSDLDRLGMLSSQALRAARLVVDSGIHTMGWTRSRRSITCSRTRPRSAPMWRRRSIATSFIRGRRPRTCSGMLEITQSAR